MAQARSGKKRGSVTYSTDRENEASNIFVIYLRLIRRAVKATSRNQAEGSTATKICRVKIRKTKSSSLAVLNSCLQDSNSFTSLCNRNDMKNLLDNVFLNFKFSGLYSGNRIRPANLANHSARTI